MKMKNKWLKLALLGALLGSAACNDRKNVIYLDPPQAPLPSQQIAVQPGPAPQVQPEVEAPAPSAFPSNVTDRVFFEKGSSALSPQAQAVLDAQARWLLDNDVTIALEGHADEQGTRDYDIALSAKRAYAVRDYLASRGVPRDRLKVTSYGKERPEATCSEESCWAQNRRVVSIVTS